MLWEKISKNKEVASLLFVTIFSLTSLIWNGNFLVSGIASFQRVGDFFSGSIDAFGGLFKSIYTKLESFEKVREERDSCLNVMEDYYKVDQELARLRKENEILRQELSFSPPRDYPTVRAEILSVRLNTIYRTIIINKGESDGVKPYMPVVARTLDNQGKFVEALVGKVIAVGGSTSVVQPLINSNFSMGVMVPNTSLWANLSGNSGRATEAVMEFIDSGIVIDPRAMGSFPMGPTTPPGAYSTIIPEGLNKIGRAVYSSGGSGVFPANIPVGYITEEGPREGSFKTAYVQPFVQFDKLEYLTILKKLPDRWIEKWPEERSVNIQNPYLGEINFPDEEKKKKEEEEKKQSGTTNGSNKPKPNSNLKPKPGGTESTISPPVTGEDSSPNPNSNPNANPNSNGETVP